MDKLAGMQGMFLKVRHETQLGDFINGDTGALLASNSSGLFPNTEGDVTAITNFTLIQMLSPTFGFYAGKLDTMDGDLNAYAHGRGKEQFMNIGIVATPIAFRTTPYSTWGAGMMVLGEEGTPILNLAVIDPRDFSTTM
jgi:porin